MNDNGKRALPAGIPDTTTVSADETVSTHKPAKVAKVVSSKASKASQKRWEDADDEEIDECLKCQFKFVSQDQVEQASAKAGGKQTGNAQAVVQNRLVYSTCCGWAVCESCSRSDSLTACPRCAAPLSKKDFSKHIKAQQLFMKQVSDSSQLSSTFNMNRENFPATPEYNSYLELVQDVLYAKTYGSAAEAEDADAKVIEFRKEFKTQIFKNLEKERASMPPPTANVKSSRKPKVAASEAPSNKGANNAALAMAMGPPPRPLFNGAPPPNYDLQEWEVLWFAHKQQGDRASAESQQERRKLKPGSKEAKDWDFRMHLTKQAGGMSLAQNKQRSVQEAFVALLDFDL